MQYALLAYAPADGTDRASRPIPGPLAARLERPDVACWARLHGEESATTVRADPSQEGQVLLTDGPFVDSKEYLAGLFLVDATDLDEAIAVAEDLMRAGGSRTVIEVRPALEWRLRGA